MELSQNDKFFAKMKFFKLFGNTIRIFDESKSQLLLFVKQKAFKLKEDITVYSDESQTKEVFKINARSILDLGAAYDVADAQGVKIGALRRKGIMSMMVMDSWEILDVRDQVIGTVIEDSWILALVRRFISSLLPQKLNILLGQKQVGELKQSWNPFLPQMYVDFSADSSKSLDRRLGIAIVILLQVIEGKQN